MNFEDDDEEIFDRLHRIEQGLPVEPVEHTPSPIHSEFFRKPHHSALGQALSNADLGVLGGAPRNPNLLPGTGSEYSTVRYAEGQYAYTKITSERNVCSVCGFRKMFLYTVMLVEESSNRQMVGTVGACKNCHPESWLFTTHMPKKLIRPFPDPTPAAMVFLVITIILVLIVMASP